MPNMYSYVHDLNTWVDPFGLHTDTPITEGYVYRGVESGGSNNYSPDTRDLSGEGISTKPPKSHGRLSTGDEIFLSRGGKTVDKIDAGKLTKGGNLVVIKDGATHASIKPSQDYLNRKNMTMTETMADWHKGGDNHELSKEIKNAASCH